MCFVNLKVVEEMLSSAYQRVSEVAERCRELPSPLSQAIVFSGLPPALDEYHDLG